MRMSRKSMVVGVVALLLCVTQAPAMAADGKMTRDEYRAKVAEYTEREATAKADILQCDAKIASLKGELEALNSQIAALNAEILQLVAATQAEIDAFGQKLDGFIRQLEGLMAMAPEEIFHHRGEIGEIAEEVAAMKQNLIAALPKIAAKIDRVEALIADLSARSPRQITTTYEVVKGDHLWGIAGKDSIYDDPYMWPRIYRANRDAIADPDLIYPRQELSVPYGVAENQYLVTRGDFLSEIAAAVYNDPSKWHKIYKANADQIVEPSLIFPAQVLEIPTN